MNKRIEELAEESGLAYLSSVHPNMWEKFADLIIKECASLVVDDYIIKEHFGVE